MSRLVTEAAALSRWSDAERLCALKRIIPLGSVTGALRDAGRGRGRRRLCPVLPDWFVVWFVVGLGLFCGDCYRRVYRWLVRRSKGNAGGNARGKPVPRRTTLCEARRRVGVRPLAALARRVVSLLADPGVPNDAAAFRRGMRLMALDGFVVDLFDSPANDAAFGRPRTGRASGAFPQARVLALCEAGTHVMWRWQVKRYRCGEVTMAPALPRHLRPGMLLLWDRNFLAHAHVRQVLDAGRTCWRG